MNTSEIGVNEHTPLNEVIFNAIRDEILMGKLSPGERLLEKQFANKMGVSRTPIREAFRKLEADGLVNITPRKGVQVASIDPKDIKDVLQVRTALELLAVRLCCENITNTQLEKLYIARDEFEEAVSCDDVNEMADRDEKFHMVILSSGNNDRLFLMLNNLREQIYRYRFIYLNDRSYRNIILREHQELTDAIADRNTELAENILKRHIKNQKRAVKKSIVLT